MKSKLRHSRSLTAAIGLFAGMHFNWHSFLPLFVLGFWLCRTYEKSGNLWVPIILHAFFNGNTLLTLMLLGS